MPMRLTPKAVFHLLSRHTCCERSIRRWIQWLGSGKDAVLMWMKECALARATLLPPSHCPHCGLWIEKNSGRGLADIHWMNTVDPYRHELSLPLHVDGHTNHIISQFWVLVASSAFCLSKKKKQEEYWILVLPLEAHVPVLHLRHFC